MRRLVLMAIFCSGVFYAPLPLIAHNGGGQTPLIPVADMPHSNGGATAPSEPPLEVDSAEVPELVPPQQVSGGAEAPGASAPAEPAPEPAPAPATAHVAVPTPPPEPVAPEPPPAAEPAQTPDDPVGQVPDQEPTDGPTTPGPEEGEQDEEQFEEDFGEGPEPGEPDAPGVTPEATAGPQLPRTGADLPALLLSGLALTASGMSLRALCRGRS